MILFPILLITSMKGENILKKRNFFWRKNMKNVGNWFKKITNISPNKNKTLRIFEKNTNRNIFFLGKNWIWNLTLGVFFLFFGFFSATSAITIIGSVADWDPLAAAVLLCWIELFTKLYYSYGYSNNFFSLLNTYKIGVIFGMFVDAFKLTG
jgi:hypothetical protein